MKKITISILCLITALNLAAQKPFTLKDLLETGLQQNYSVQIIRNSQEISDNNVTLGNAGFLPTVDFAGGYTGNVDDIRTTPREGASTHDKGVYNQNANAGLNASWYIFNGFRILANYDRLKELQALGGINTRITMENFIANFTAEYYNLIQQKIRLKNFAYAVSLSKERLRVVELRKEVGSGSGLNILQARVDFNADSSRYMSQQAVVMESQIRLNEMLAHTDVNASIPISDSLIAINDRLDRMQLEEQTLLTNASLLASDKNTALAELELKTLKSRNYPYVTMGTGYGYAWNGYGIGTTLSRGVLGFNAGATVGITVFDGNRRREQKNARIQIDNTRLMRDQLQNSLMADLANFWQAYRNNLQIVRMETENLVAAKENYNIAMERYRIGILSGIEMREAQQSLLDAEERILTATYNTKLCEISLLQISGNVLAYLE